jgi:hypothetical protein
MSRLGTPRALACWWHDGEVPLGRGVWCLAPRPAFSRGPASTSFASTPALAPRFAFRHAGAGSKDYHRPGWRGFTPAGAANARSKSSTARPPGRVLTAESRLVGLGVSSRSIAPKASGCKRNAPAEAWHRAVEATAACGMLDGWPRPKGGLEAGRVRQRFCRLWLCPANPFCPMNRRLAQRMPYSGGGGSGQTASQGRRAACWYFQRSASCHLYRA